MRTLVLMLFLTCLLAVAEGCSRRKKASPEADSPAEGPGPASTPRSGRAFTTGKATTYVTGPKTADGHIDYAAAMTERLARGVTPETNANVLFWKAFGPAPAARLSPAYFEKMGTPPPRPC